MSAGGWPAMSRLAGHVDGGRGGHVLVAHALLLAGAARLRRAASLEHAQEPVVAVGLHLAAFTHALLTAGGETERSEQREHGGQPNEASHRASIARPSAGDKSPGASR